MKTKLIYLLLPVICLIAIGCDKNNEETTQPQVEGSLINHSDCISFKTRPADADSNESCIEYTFDSTSNKLLLKHLNAGFNCAPGELSCEITFSNDTIFVEEFETWAIANCNCLFNLDIEINGIKAKRYYLKMIEPYIQGQETLEFYIDLKQTSSGEYCVERYKYPWGI